LNFKFSDPKKEIFKNLIDLAIRKQYGIAIKQNIPIIVKIARGCEIVAFIMLPKIEIADIAKTAPPVKITPVKPKKL